MPQYLLFLFVHAIEGAKTLCNYLALSTLGFKIPALSPSWVIDKVGRGRGEINRHLRACPGQTGLSDNIGIDSTSG